MKFPYGICDFKEIITGNYFYCDRTDRIPLLERGKYSLFIRPRRFGKSLLLSMLFNYYDVAKADEFDALFGDLEIGKNPTPLHNQYFILQWDFSCVDPSGSEPEIKQALHDHVNACIKDFKVYYRDFLKMDIEVDSGNSLNSIHSLITSVRMSGRPVYLLIDEYDNFANEVMMGVRRRHQNRYEALVYEEGPLRTLFKVVKSSTSQSLFDRIFITGVSPVVMSDITSGYNIAKNVYLKAAFNDLCGFTHADVEKVIDSVAEESGLEKTNKNEVLDMMRTWYNGYKFAPGAEEAVYNPTLTLYFIDAFYETRAYPRNMLDTNLAMDAGKLEYISQIPNGGQLLLNLMRNDHRVVITEPADRFGIREMVTDQSKDNTFMVSFLYYFGVLTIRGLTEAGEVSLAVPNLVMKKLYVERLQMMLLPEPRDRDEGTSAAKKLYQEGDMGPLCEFVEHRYFKVFHNPDYRWANELTVKTAFLTLLYNDILYNMDSETEIDRRYADLAMIVRPDMRRFNILDILIEFKFVKLKDAGLTGEQARKLTRTELQALPRMTREMAQARRQVRDYGNRLEKRFEKIRLRRYAVVSLGFERIWWSEANGD
ncbi:MAG: AAA family ATPase [Thermodesulfobacteriota bacterium]